MGECGGASMTLHPVFLLPRGWRGSPFPRSIVSVSTAMNGIAGASEFACPIAIIAEPGSTFDLPSESS